MKKTSLALLFLALIVGGVLVSAKYFPQGHQLQGKFGTGTSDWVTLSEDLSVDKEGSKPSATILGANLYVIWEEGSPKQEVYVKSYNSTKETWKLLQADPINSSDSTIDIIYTALTGLNGKLYAAWVQENPNLGLDDLGLQFWTGQSWSSLDSILGFNQIDNVGGLSIANTLDEVFIEFYEQGETYVAVKKKNNNYYELLNNQAFTPVTGTGTVGRDVRITADEQKLYIAYLDDYYDYNLTLEEWDGSTWTQVGDTVNLLEKLTWSTHFDLDDFKIKDGIPYVVVSENSTSYPCSFSIVYWNGTEWLELGGDINEKGLVERITNASLDFLNGVPVLAYVGKGTNSGIYEGRVAYWDEQEEEWVQLGSSELLNSDSSSEVYSVDLVAKGKQLFLVFDEDSMSKNFEVKVKMFEL